MDLNPLNNNTSQQVSKPGRADDQKGQLKQACQEFESLFLTQILSEMRKTGFKSDLFGDSQEEDLWKGMLDQQQAETWSKQGGVGLADLLYQQMKGRL